MLDKKGVYPEIEAGYVFKPHLNDKFVNVFNNQTFNQHGNESATSKNKRLESSKSNISTFTSSKKS